MNQLEKLCLQRIHNLAFNAGIILYRMKGIDQASDDYKEVRAALHEIENLGKGLEKNDGK